jgi:hypothetical protein
MTSWENALVVLGQWRECLKTGVEPPSKNLVSDRNKIGDLFIFLC